MSFYLKRIGLPPSIKDAKNSYRINSNTTLIGRGPSVDIFLDSNIRKGLISRAHAQIIQNVNKDKTVTYELFDTSLNGTFVNNIRVNGSVILRDGDEIAFGHLQGSVIEPGCFAPQSKTEFLFKFEKQNDSDEPQIDGNLALISSNSPLLPEIFSCGVSGICTKPQNSMQHTDSELTSILSVVATNISSKEDSSDSENFDTNIKESVFMFRTPTKKKRRLNTKVKFSSFKSVPLSTINYNDSSSDNDIKSDASLNIKHLFNKARNESTMKFLKSSQELSPKGFNADDIDIPACYDNIDSDVSEEISEEDSDSDFSALNFSKVSNRVSQMSSSKKLKVEKISPSNNSSLKGSKKPTSTGITTRYKNGKTKAEYTHDSCSSWDCKRPSGANKVITWVQCDDCDAWYHVACSGLSAKQAKREDTNFHCGCS